jgi:hypothetical protein
MTLLIRCALGGGAANVGDRLVGAVDPEQTVSRCSMVGGTLLALMQTKQACEAPGFDGVNAVDEPGRQDKFAILESIHIETAVRLARRDADICVASAKSVDDRCGNFLVAVAAQARAIRFRIMQDEKLDGPTLGKWSEGHRVLPGI